MPVTIAQFVETPGAPLVCTSPLISLPYFEQSVPGAGNAYILWSIGGNFAVGPELIWPGNQVIMGHIVCQGPQRGGALSIEASPTGLVGSWQDILVINLLGNGLPNVFGPVELPGWNFRFRLWNLDSIIQGFIGYIAGKGH